MNHCDTPTIIITNGSIVPPASGIQVFSCNVIVRSAVWLLDWMPAVI